ncbi:MAG: 16S rRNA (adenine(1518)-N(6)/adenine(1519)-N(6))-dimethyltransferase RsmA [Planctomycetota bacterium]
MPGHTKTELQALLAAAGLAPLHRFGQNFLVDLNLMRKLVSAAKLQPEDVVLEIGCATGSLTEFLLDSGAYVIGVEIDHGLQRILQQRLGTQPRFTLVPGDALASKNQINPLILQQLAEHSPAPGGAYKLVANLPYQIATPLLMELLLVRPPFALLVATIQREVGLRLGAQPATAEYGPISVITATLAELHPLAILPRTAFWPQPRVESAMLAIQPRAPTDLEPADIPAFVDFVRASFRNRRKKLVNTLSGRKPSEAREVFEQLGINPDARAETLSPAQWRSLFAALLAS